MVDRECMQPFPNGNDRRTGIKNDASDESRPGERLGKPWQEQDAGGTGLQKLPRAPVVVDSRLDRRRQDKRPLHFVDDRRTVKAGD